MVKQTWNIDENEKFRILNLHESATKNLYLIKEQNTEVEDGEKSWSLCGTIVYQKGNKYYAEVKNGEMIEIPALSEVKGTIQNRKLILDPITQNGVDVGEMMSQSICAYKRPMAYRGNVIPFCFFDDLSSRLVGVRGKEQMVPLNTPVYGVLCEDGTLQTGGGDFIDTPIQKDRNGVEIQYGQKRSKSFIFEVSPAMQGTERVKKKIEPNPEKEPEPISLNIESPFIFDKTDLTPEALGKFNKFVEDIKNNYQGVTGNVDVITSASIDADPAKKEKYNMDLSTRRANAIIQKLKDSLGQTSLTFIPKPIGQTDRYAPGMKFPEITDINKTAPNRRLIINLPKITKSVK